MELIKKNQLKKTELTRLIRIAYDPDNETETIQ
jgi:hypothetical protein